ncbi:hypothetical protein MMC30_006640 [Trapelia coarctata]|nr:hypothetical protein [Trapelia coarctata]
MSLDRRPSTPEEVGERLLRRIEVAKMARNLQDHLALASYKAKHNLVDQSFRVVDAHVQAHIDAKAKRRRTTASVISSSSSSSSSTSDHRVFSSRALASSPSSGPFYSDNLYGSGDIHNTRSKRTRFQPTYLDYPGTQPRHSKQKSKRTHSMAPPSFDSTRQSWGTMHNHPVSSPLKNRVSSSYPTLSYASQSSTIPTSPPAPFDDDDDNDLPTHSFCSNLHGSPPRTPPPTRSRGALRKNARTATGEEGADLLLYLATSPSPANPTQTPKSRLFPPSTPPQTYAGIPTSLLATPGGTNLFTGFSTPGNNNFNFADFVNVTPSPAQGAFGNRTPGVLKTPREAGRRRLNFDMGAASPSVGRGGERGLGMELGGELVS